MKQVPIVCTCCYDTQTIIFGACSHLGMENCEAVDLTVSSPDWTKSMVSLREGAVNLLLFVTLGIVSELL